MKSRFFSKRIVSFFTALIMTVAFVLPVLVACGSSGESGYTYNEYISRFPSSWSTHNGTSDADLYVQQYTEIGLYAYTLSEDKSTYAFVDEMATGDPVNVTESYKGRFGVGENEETNNGTGKAWEITLNPDATWENGVKITAEDYVWSMERVLSPEMKNSLALTYTTGETAIYNAKSYYNGGTTLNYELISTELTDEEVQQGIAEKSLYFSLTAGKPIIGKLSLQGYHDMFERNARFFRKDLSEDPEVRDWYVYLTEQYGSSADELGYILLTSENYADIKEGMTILAENLGSSLADWTLTLSKISNTHPEYTLISEEKTDTEINELISSGKLYFSLTAGTPIAGSLSLQGYHDLFERNARFFRKDKSEDPEVRDWYVYLTEQYGSSADENGYIQVTSSNFDDIKEGMSILSENLGSSLPQWYYTTSILEYVENESVPFDEVGILKTGDYKFVIVFENALSKWQVKNLLTSNWIVYKPYYEEGYKQQGSLTVTTYGTTSGKYMGYGPYKLSSYEIDKQIVLVRNENWYGYNKDACNYHEGEYMTDKIVCQIISDQATALLEFESGNLDNVVLSANDTDKYKFSDYLLKRTASNTWSISFNSDPTTLKEIESDGKGNRRILSVYEFRKALSLSLDRSYIGQNIMVGSAAAFSFINSNFYYDLENKPDSIYRDTDQAKQAIVDLYGIEYGTGKTYQTLDEAYRAITGYDIESAKANFVTAYEKAVAEGLYNDGDKICINIYITATTTKFTALVNYIQQQVNAATVGTKLEGKITVSAEAWSSNISDALNQGKIEARYYSFAGDYSNPNGMIANFTDANANTIPECGFDPLTETFSITADFNDDGEQTTVTKTYDAWQKSIAAGGEYATASESVRLTILSQLEYNLLNGFRTLPLCVGTDLTLYSKKVNFGTNNANIFVAYGGVRLMTYNYNDAEWAKFCKKSSNLNYT